MMEVEEIQAGRMKYQRKIESDGTDSLSKVAKCVKPGSSVLDLGIGVGDLGRYLATERDCVVDGIELVDEFIVKAEPYYREIFQYDLDQLDWIQQLAARRYDYIICADILEHLVNATAVLAELQRLLTDDGRIVLSIPNVSYIGVALELLEGQFNYREEGILDRTHVKFYTQQSLCDYVLTAGYDILSMQQVVIPLSKSEFSHFKPELLPSALLQLIQKRTDALVYQYVLLLAPKSEAEAVNRAVLETVDSSSVMNQFVQRLHWMSTSDVTYSAKKMAANNLALDDGTHRTTYDVSDNEGVELVMFSPADRCGYLEIKRFAIEELGTGCLIDLVQCWDQVIDQALMQQIIVTASPRDTLQLFINGSDPWFEINIKQLFDGKLPTKLHLTIECSRPVHQDYQPLLAECKKQAEVSQGYVNQIGELRARVRGFDKEVVLLREQIGEQEQQLVALREEAARDKSLLQAIQSSLSWRFISKIVLLSIPLLHIKTRRKLQLVDIEDAGIKRKVAYVNDKIKLKGNTGKLVFPLSSMHNAKYFFHCRYRCEGKLIGPKISFRCGDSVVDNDNQIYQNYSDTLMFGYLKIVPEFDAIILTPSHIDSEVTIESFKLSLLAWHNGFIYESPWYWRPLIYGRRWLYEYSRKNIKDWLSGKIKGYGKRDYQNWWRLFGVPTKSGLLEQTKAAKKLPLQPVISILVPVYNTPETYLRKMIDSVLAQSYENWQLCIADDASSDPKTRHILQAYSQKDSRIQLVYRQENGHISAATNSALAVASGDYIGLLDHDDELAPQALYRVVEAINRHSDAKLFYSDEDIIDGDNRPLRGHFKPEWNPDLLRSINYICHFLVIEKQHIDNLGGLRLGYEGAQDYDLLLRATLTLSAEEIKHIPYVLYHWRSIAGSTAKDSSEKDYAKSAGISALQSYMASTGEKAAVLPSEIDTAYRVKYDLPQPSPLVSIIIPTYNNRNILENCIESVIAKTDYENYEIVVIDNRSDEADCLAYLKNITADSKGRVKVLSYDKPFNFSAINNYAVTQTKGEVLLFLNNDVEVMNSEWLTEMVSQACRENIGAVGAKLFFINNYLQHSGVVLGLGPEAIAGHAYRGFHAWDLGMLGRLRLVQNYSAVTAACLAIRRERFQQVGGFNDEDLKVAFNDVDLCLKLTAAGYRNVWTPYAQLYHFESISRGYEVTPEKRARFETEVDYMKRQWGQQLQTDPAYNPNLTLEYENFSLAWPPRV